MEIFVSHAAKDQGIAADLARSLSAVGYSISFPKKPLPRGENWNLKIGQALERSQAMIAIVSPNSRYSDLFRQEISYALGSENYQNRLIPVLLGNPKKVPWILKALPMIRFKGNVEDVANKVRQVLSTVR